MNKYPDILGFHTGGGRKLDHINWDELTKFSRTLQFFVGSPMSQSWPSQEAVKKLLNFRAAGGRPVIHSPYLVNMVRPNKETMGYTFKYMEMLYSMIREFGQEPIPYVTHVGRSTPDKEQDLKIFRGAVQHLSKFLKERNLKYHVLLETEPGSKEGSDATSLANMVEIVAEVADPGIKICFDTEHSYANGLDVNVPLPIHYWDVIGCVHLNAVPANVKFGGHLDRHSLTPLEENSIANDYAFFTLQECIKRDIPCILERREMDIIVRDILFLNSRI